MYCKSDQSHYWITSVAKWACTATRLEALQTPLRVRLTLSSPSGRLLIGRAATDARGGLVIRSRMLLSARSCQALADGANIQDEFFKVVKEVCTIYVTNVMDWTILGAGVGTAPQERQGIGLPLTAGMLLVAEGVLPITPATLQHVRVASAVVHRQGPRH